MQKRHARSNGLLLNRETIRQLDKGELTKVGAGIRRSADTNCSTWDSSCIVTYYCDSMHV